MGKHGPTLADVARVAGVSRSTASNAYNRPDQLSVRVRERVLAAAATLGYAGPDPLARQLRTRRSGTVGVLVLERPGYAFSDPAAQLFLDGLAEGLGDAATGLLLLWGSAETGGPPPTAVRAAGVDGFVSYCLPGDTAALDAVEERALPLVTIDGAIGRGEACVRVANRAGQAAAVRHLLDLGHRRFGVVSMPLRADGFFGLATPGQLLDVTDPSSRDRLEAVRDELDRAGIAPTSVPVAVARSSHPSDGRELARVLLGLEHRPTAVIALSDRLALGCVDGARSLGLRVPADLSVTGFDAIPEAYEAEPALTTVAQDHALKGRLSGQLLREMLDGHPPRDLEVGTRLVVGGSTGPPPDDSATTRTG
ncbi:MAG TPA: LacI family DNA-binding transcriptional regulator [Jiangellales bacterium]|nr:LacI family DNA-binding transcriptional regulator [Jiangellales bacterium]